MADYRIYLLDRANHVVEVAWIAAASDGEALAAARVMSGASRREIWLGTRLVATVHVSVEDKPSAAFWL